MSVQINGIDIESGLVTIATATDPAIDAAVSSAIVGTYGGVLITLTAAGNAQTLQNPTQIATIKTFTVINNDTSGANTIAVNGITLAAGKSQSFIWDGSAWGPTSLGITAIPVPVVQGGTGSATGNVSGLDMSTPPAIGGTTPAAGTFTQVNTGYTTVASHATTSAIWAAAGNVIDFTGAETITDFPAAPQAGAGRTLICAGACIFTHAGNITVLGAANYTASANAVVQVIALSTTTFLVVPLGGRVKFPGGANEDGLVFGSLGTAIKGIDLSGSGLSGDSDYWIYGDATNFWSADGLLENYSTKTALLYDKLGNKIGDFYTYRSNAFTYYIQTIANGTFGINLLLNSKFLLGNLIPVGSLTACTSNGTTTIAKTAHGLSPAAGDLVHVTGATTTADKGFYRYISGDADTMVVDRALSGSDADVALTIYQDVVGIFATDGTNGQRIMNYSHQNKPLQLGGDVLAATDGLVGDDVVIGGSLGINDHKITAGSGAGITVNNSSLVNRQLYKVTTTYAAFSDADTTKGIVIATLPAKMKIVGFYSDTTTKFIGGAISAATLEVGITAEGAAEIIAPHDVFAAAVTKGLADADMGTGMTRAAQIQGGYLPSWTGTTAIYATIDTTTANTDALTQGSVTFYIETEQL